MNALFRSFFEEDVARFTQALADFDRRIDPRAEPDSAALLKELTNQIEATLVSCARLESQFPKGAQELKEAQASFRAAIWPWFDRSWFMHRALSKPRGYPGDYELLTAIYDRQPKSPGLGGYLDRYFLGTTLGRGVVARMQNVRQFLLEEIGRREGEISVLNVACGSCREYLPRFDFAPGRHVQLTCLDNDQLALDFVRENVAPHVPCRLKMSFIRYNALRMTSAPVNRERFGRSDIIYSVGLCDYIPDHYLVPMLKGWRESLQERGVVYVAFKDMRCYSKTEYQWLTDWYFYQRTEQECRGLFAAAGYDMAAIEMTRDETGAIMNFVARSGVPEARRMDPAEQLPLPQHTDIAAPLMDGTLEMS